MSDRAFQVGEGNYEFDEDAPDELVAGERIATSAPSGRRSTMLSAMIVVVTLAGAAWAISKNQAALEQAKGLAKAALASVMERTATQAPPAPPPTVAAPSQALTAPVETVEVKPAPGADAGEPAPPVETVVAAPAAAGSEDQASDAPLPAPVVDPKDPNQKRAVAAGLHPSLSKALLTRMSPDDYRNAGRAIKTALAETPDGETYAWPQKASQKLARFEVHFVAGAPADCRRYVVIVTKDRWSTTARPMETCGVKAAGKRAKAAKVG